MKRSLALVCFAVAACGGNNPATTSPSPVPPIPTRSGINVLGRVVNRSGEPVAGARVRIGTAPLVTTDAQGRFTVDAAPTTYDAAVEFDDPDAPPGGPAFVGHAVVYQGLTRADPVLFLPRLRTPGSGSTSHSTPVQIGTSGVPTGAGVLLWAFTNPAGFVAPGHFTGAPMSFAWDGPANGVNPGKIVVVSGSSLGGPIDASGSAPVTAGDGLLSVTVPLTTTAAFQISGTSRPPAGCALGSHDVVIPATDGTTVTTVSGASGSHPTDAPVTFNIDAGFTSEVPLSLRVPVTCLVPGTSVVARRLSPSKTSFAIDVPAPPRITAPATGATVTLTTPLQWTAPAGAVNVLHFNRVDRNGFLVGTLDVATASTSTTFPDLTALGAVIVPGFGTDWQMETWGGVTTTDGLADASTGFGALLAGAVDFSHGLSDSISVAIAR